MIAQLVRYSPSIETPEPDEAETNRQLTETLLKISEITWKDSGHAIRSVHAKAHGLLNADVNESTTLPHEHRAQTCPSRLAA